MLYWLATVLLVTANGAVMFQAIGTPELAEQIGARQASFHALASVLALFTVPITVFSNVAVAMKRLHDMGYSGFLALALFVPFVNIGFTIWAGIVPGTPGPNQYGQATDVPPA